MNIVRNAWNGKMVVVKRQPKDVPQQRWNLIQSATKNAQMGSNYVMCDLHQFHEIAGGL
jgi:hypothetical protein